MSKNDTYESVWDALADTPEQAANWYIRAQLINQLRTFIAAKNWALPDAASRCGLTEVRLNALLNGEFSRFSLDSLLQRPGS